MGFWDCAATVPSRAGSKRTITTTFIRSSRNSGAIYGWSSMRFAGQQEVTPADHLGFPEYARNSCNSQDALETVRKTFSASVEMRAETSIVRLKLAANSAWGGAV